MRYLLDGDDAIAAFVERSKPLDLSELDATPPADDPSHAPPEPDGGPTT